MTTPRIVVLDGYPLSPLALCQKSSSDPSWDELATLGELILYPRTSPDEFAARTVNATALLTNKAPISAAQMDALPELKYIGVTATGTNIVDLAAAKERGICVTNVPDYSTTAVAQLVFALLLEALSRTHETTRTVREGRWSASPDFCFTLGPIRELAGKVLGVAGFGAIGQQVARIGAAFGMKVLIHSRTQKESDFPMEWAKDWHDLFKRADFLSFHCPLTPETEKIVNAHNLWEMKRSAMVINTGRGGLVNETHLADALNRDIIAGYFADVLSIEPPSPENPLLKAKNTYITPHVGWASVEARHRLMKEVTENLRAFLAGNARNVVNA